MERTPVSTGDAPAAIGPYSQAISVAIGGGKMVFTSGQIALDPKSGALLGGADAAAQAQQVMANLRAVLAASGATFDHVVKTTIYLADMADFAAVNEVYGKVFAKAPPARSTVQAAGLPKAARVEIDMVAVVPA